MAFKDDFKKGCEAAGGDFVENASDDSFSCNIRTGGTIRCVGTSCSYSPKFKGDTGVVSHSDEARYRGIAYARLVKQHWDRR